MWSQKRKTVTSSTRVLTVIVLLPLRYLGDGIDLEFETVMQDVGLVRQRVAAALEPQRLGLVRTVGSRGLEPSNSRRAGSSSMVDGVCRIRRAEGEDHDQDHHSVTPERN